MNLSLNLKNSSSTLFLQPIQTHLLRILHISNFPENLSSVLSLQITHSPFIFLAFQVNQKRFIEDLTQSSACLIATASLSDTQAKTPSWSWRITCSLIMQPVYTETSHLQHWIYRRKPFANQ